MNRLMTQARLALKKSQPFVASAVYDDRDRFWLAASAISLTQALFFSRLYGFRVVAFTFLAAAIVTLTFSFFTWPKRVVPSLAARAISCAITLELASAMLLPPTTHLKFAERDVSVYFGLGWTVIVTALLFWAVPSLRPLWFILLLAEHGALAVLVLTHVRPVFDVLMIQDDSVGALLHARNPYAITFRDIYSGKSNFYGPGLTGNGRLLFGFPYPPLSLLLVVPGYLAGDVRYAHVVAVLAAALLMYLTATDSLGQTAAILFLFTPGVFFMEAQSWTDVFCVATLAATTYASVHLPRRSPWMLGLFFAAKQYTFMTLPAAWRVFGRWFVIFSVTVAVLVCIPFVLPDWRAFLGSTVSTHLRQPWRGDSLSFAVLLNDLGVVPRLGWLGFLAAAFAAVLSVWKGKCHPAEFARSGALILIVFFAFGKQAFYNYYFMVVGMLCCALAACSFDQHQMTVQETVVARRGNSSD